jgi:hypothetical protein
MRMPQGIIGPRFTCATPFPYCIIVGTFCLIAIAARLLIYDPCLIDFIQYHHHFLRIALHFFLCVLQL